MDEPSQPRTGRGRHSQRSQDWMWKVVVPVGVAVIGALLVAALTPVGDGLRELLFPTRAVVTGSVLVDGQPTSSASVTLDGGDAVPANEAGEFQLVGVGAGTHALRMEAGGAIPRDHPFVVQRKSPTLDLGEIDLDPLLRLGYAASLDPLQATGLSGGSATVDYDLTLWIEGAPEVMTDILSVSYTLPPPLPSTAVPGGSAEQAFCYREQSGLKFQDLFVIGGAFTTATATVVLVDGQKLQLSATPSNLQPQQCPVTQRAGSVPMSSPAPPPPPPSPPPPPAPTFTPTPPPASTSSAPALIEVPDVVCVGVSEATEKLLGAGLNVQLGDPVPPNPECPTPGVVAQQDTAVGSEVPPETLIVIHLGE